MERLKVPCLVLIGSRGVKVSRNSDYVGGIDSGKNKREKATYTYILGLILAVVIHAANK